MTTSETVTFRTTRTYWRRRILEYTPIVILGILVLIFLDYVSLSNNIVASLFVLFSFGVSIIWMLFVVWIRIHAELTLDQTYIRGNTGLKSFQFAWDEVVAINQVITDDKSKDPELLLFTEKYELTMDLTGFDETAVWQAINEYAPPTVLEPDAYKRLDYFQIYEQNVQTKLPLKISTSPLLRLFFVGCTCFFLFCMVMSLQTEPIAGVIFGIFLLLSIPCSLSLFKIIIIDKEKLIYKRFWITKQFSWTEVNYIEIYKHAKGMVIHCGTGKLTIPSFEMWGGKQKGDFLFIFSQQIEEQKIEVKENRTFIPLIW